MPAIEHITIRGFKSISSIERLALRPVNVLIGANGSGKSNFIGVFEFLKAIQKNRLEQYARSAGGAENVLHFGSKTTKSIVADLELQDGTGCEFKVSPTVNDSLFLDDKMPYGVGPPRPFEARWSVHFCDTSASSPMRKTAKLHDNRLLREDGSNLPAFLYYLQTKQEDAFGLLRKTIRKVAPFFDDFQLEPLKLKPDDIKLEWRHKHSEQYFDASSLSDGTLRFIALATLFLQPEEDRPPVVLVDEPELGLHPYAITILASLIRQASTKTQVIVSTQSPTLVDHFDPEDVLVAERVNGATQLTRLDSARLAEWLKDYSLGQLWEKNEIGGRPVPE